tara:strand:- start:444 stop:593 length:150 start_codon:yes stop_codon:yes gene_type:complete
LGETVLQRRRSNHPGNSQAKGPIKHNTLERDLSAEGAKTLRQKYRWGNN